MGYELPERGDEAKVARSLRRSANAEYAQTPLAAVPIPIWREALAVERPALPQVSDAELAAPLAALTFARARYLRGRGRQMVLAFDCFGAGPGCGGLADL